MKPLLLPLEYVPMSGLIHNLLDPWHLTLDVLLLIGFCTLIYFIRRKRIDS